MCWPWKLCGRFQRGMSQNQLRPACMLLIRFPGQIQGRVCSPRFCCSNPEKHVYVSRRWQHSWQTAQWLVGVNTELWLSLVASWLRSDQHLGDIDNHVGLSFLEWSVCMCVCTQVTFFSMEVKKHTNDSKDNKQSRTSSALLCVFVSVYMLWTKCTQVHTHWHSRLTLSPFPCTQR